MNMPVKGPLSPPTRPAANPSLSTPVGTGPLTPAQSLPVTTGGATILADDNRVDVPAVDQTEPNQVTLPELSVAQLSRVQDLEALFQPGAKLSGDAGKRLNQLARELGFKDLGMLQHHLRNLSPAQRQGLISDLRTQLAKGGKPDGEIVRAQFQQAFRSAIDALFVAADGKPLPSPSFQSEPAGQDRWDTASLASVYNGLATVKQQDPKRFTDVATSGRPLPDGSPSPLRFVRRASPEIDNPNQYLQTMLQAVQIAHADPDSGFVYLYDTAVQGSHKPITDLVVDKLRLISQKDHNSSELRPVYPDLGKDLAKRGIQKLKGESDGKYAERLRGLITGELLERYGNKDWHRLQEAVNFIIRYKGLDDPAVINKGITDPTLMREPMKPVPGNSMPSDPATLAALERLGPSVLQMVICRLEQTDAVAQLQTFLRGNLPGSETLAADGMIGKETRKMVTAFQTSIALNNIKERIEDDPGLPEPRKRELLDHFTGLFQQLSKNPDQAESLLGQATAKIYALLRETPTPLAEHTQAGLKEDLSKLKDVVNGHFNPSTAGYLVGNWLNVMDSGKGQDLAEQLVVHELGHLWEHALDKHGSLEVEKNWAQISAGSKHGKSTSQLDDTDIEKSATQMTVSDFHECFQNDHCASSDYGSANAGEDFAEATRVMTYDPDRLMRRSLMKFLYVNALSGKPMPADDIMKLAEKCGYSPDQLRERLDAFLGKGEGKVQFSLKMASHLQATYQDLGNRLAASSEPVSVSFTGVGPPQPAPPPTSGGATGPKPSESGWLFNRLTEQIRDLNRDIAQASSPAAQGYAENRLKTLIESFVRSGPEGVQGLGDAEGNGSFTAALAARGLIESQDQASSSYAAVAALALLRASDQPDQVKLTDLVDAYPALKEFLPSQFAGMVEDPGIRSALNPATPFNPTLLLEGAVDRLAWCNEQQAILDKRVTNANIRLSSLPELLGDMLSGAASGAASLVGPVFGPSAAGAAEAFETRLREVFADKQDKLDGARAELNLAVAAINRLTGSKHAPLSDIELQQLLKEIYSTGEQKITAEKLTSFLMQRTVGILIRPEGFGPAPVNNNG